MSSSSSSIILLCHDLGITESILEQFMNQPLQHLLIVYRPHYNQPPICHFIESTDYLSIKIKRGSSKTFRVISKLDLFI
jgi:hypothetical protein